MIKNLIDRYRYKDAHRSTGKLYRLEKELRKTSIKYASQVKALEDSDGRTTTALSGLTNADVCKIKALYSYRKLRDWCVEYQYYRTISEEEAGAAVDFILDVFAYSLDALMIGSLKSETKALKRRLNRLPLDTLETLANAFDTIDESISMSEFLEFCSRFVDSAMKSAGAGASAGITTSTGIAAHQTRH